MYDYLHKYSLLVVYICLLSLWAGPAMALDGSVGLSSTGKTAISVNILPHLDILAGGSKDSNDLQSQLIKNNELCIVSNTRGAAYKVQLTSLEDSISMNTLSVGWASTDGAQAILTSGETSNVFIGAETAADCEKGSNASLSFNTAGVNEPFTGSLTFLILPD